MVVIILNPLYTPMTIYKAIPKLGKFLQIITPSLFGYSKPKKMFSWQLSAPQFRQGAYSELYRFPVNILPLATIVGFPLANNTIET